MAKAKQKPVDAGGWKWTGLQGLRKDQWLVEQYEGGVPPRIKQMDNSTFYCYRDGVYLGSEKTLEDAKARCVTNKISDRNAAIREWERGGAGELPPGLQLTEAERRQHWHHHPPKATPKADFGAGGSRRVAPDALGKVAAPKAPPAEPGGKQAPQKGPAGSQAVAPGRSGGRGGALAPERQEAPVAGRYRVSGAAIIRAKPGTVPVGKPGTKWQQRQRAVLACVGKSVEYCLSHGGDKDAIKHMTLKGVITTEE